MLAPAVFFFFLTTVTLVQRDCHVSEFNQGPTGNNLSADSRRPRVAGAWCRPHGNVSIHTAQGWEGILPIVLGMNNSVKFPCPASSKKYSELGGGHAHL